MAHLEKPPIALGFSHDGVDDYVEVADNPSLDITDKITIEAWVKRTANWSDYWRLVVGKPTYNNYGLILEWYSGNPALFNILSNGTRYNVLGDGTPLNEWLHIVGTYDRAEGIMRLYYNGSLNKTKNIGDKPIDVNTEPLKIGGYGVNVAPAIINEVRIYNRALSLTEISDRYSVRRNIMEGCVLKLGTVGLVRGGGTQWLDESPYKNHGTVYGAKRVRCCHCNVVRDYGA